MDKEKNITVKELMSSFYDRDVENLTLSQIFTIRSLHKVCNLDELSNLITSTAQAFGYEIDICDFNVQNIDEILSAFNESSNIKNISTNNPQYITKLSYPNPSILKIILCTNTVNKINTPFIAANKILFIFHYLFPFLNQ